MKQKIILLLMISIIFPDCSNIVESPEIFIPEIYDGLTHIKFNNLANETALFGSWTAPLLSKNKKFYRVLKSSGGGINFYVPKKETYIIDLLLMDILNKFQIKISNKNYPIRKKNSRLIIKKDKLKVGWNKLQFILSESQRISIEEIKIFPRRYHGLRQNDKTIKILTPAKIWYYLNPNKDKKIQLQFSVKTREELEAELVIQSENNSQIIKKFIDNRQWDLLPIDNTFHKISITLPQTKKNYISLQKSLLIKKFPRESHSQEFEIIKKKIKPNMNVLIIILDAARADHLSAFGYQRITTPFIDQLVDDSISFTNCISESAYTLGSTGTLLTGLPPDLHNVTTAFFSRLAKNITTLTELFKSKKYFTGAISSNPYFGKAYSYHKGFDDFIELFKDKELVMAEEFVRPFENMIKKSSNKPFFIYLHLREPHADFLMPPPYLGTFQKKYLKQSKELLQLSRKIYQGKIREKEDLQLLIDLYDENLLYADSVVEKLIDILKEHRIFNQTIKIILSDHGEGLGEHNLIGHNINLYKEGITIPLIINIPGLKFKQRFVNKPAITSDLVITLAEIFDLPYPYYHVSFGKNLFSLPEVRNRFCRSVSLKNRYHGYMIESFPYKLIFFPPMKRKYLELYHLRHDPSEREKIKNSPIPKKVLLYYLSNFLKRSNFMATDPRKARLRKKDIENLKSLGYLK